MPNRSLVSRLALLAAAAFMAGSKCGDENVSPFFTDAEWATIQTLSNLPAVPPDTTNAVANNAAAAELGKQYFFDPRFSGPLTHTDNTLVPQGNGAVGATATVSCARCHNPATGFSDQRTVPDNTSLGAAFTGRNAPTLYNVEHNTWYFWDGRKDSLWSQALGPTESAVEHNGNRVQFAMVIRDLYADGSVTTSATASPDHDNVFGLLSPLLDQLDNPLSPLGVLLGGVAFPTPPAAPHFATQGRPGDSGDAGAGSFAAYDDLPQAYKDEVNKVFAQFGKAIHAYERLIVSDNADFDRFVAGQPSGFSPAAQRGLKVFIGKGQCVVCHSGPNFSDNLFHNLGVAQLGMHVPPADEGRWNGVPQVVADPFNGAGAFSDNTVAGAAKLSGLLPQPPSNHGAFKTPTLRSIGETGPYMHTGSIMSLLDVVNFYDRGGDSAGFVGTKELVPLGLTAGERDDLVAFMLALDGEDLPVSVTSVPTLP